MEGYIAWRNTQDELLIYVFVPIYDPPVCRKFLVLFSTPLGLEYPNSITVYYAISESTVMLINALHEIP